MKVLFLEPFDGGSHRAFARGWAARSRHDVTVQTLPARFWKWRLRGAAFAFAERLRRASSPAGMRRSGARPREHHAPGPDVGRLSRGSGHAKGAGERSQRGRGHRAASKGYDAVVATSLMNAADFMAASRVRAPLVVYFHENQLSYPRPPAEPLDHGLALASLASAAAADAVVFNSRFHRAAFLRGLGEWIDRFPEHAPRRTAAAIGARSCIIPPGIDWGALSPFAERADPPRAGRPRGRRSARRHEKDPDGIHRSRIGNRAGEALVRRSRALPPQDEEPPLILWNHRWDFDKNPSAFFAALGVLAARGRRFRLALLGENTQFVPKPFLEARERLGACIVRYGYVRSPAAYRAWLGRADIVVSTARQENFGLAIAEAVAAGAFPVLPARLSYPELLPRRLHSECLYRSQEDLVRRLDGLLAHRERLDEGRRERSRLMRRYDWPVSAARLDDLVESVTRSRGAMRS